MTQKERLVEILSRCFQIGDSYAYNLTRDKAAFSVGTMSLEDFEEFDEETVADIADHLLENGIVVPPCKVGDTVYAIARNIETNIIAVHRGYIGSISIRSTGNYLFVCHEGLDDEPYFKNLCGTFEDFGKYIFISRDDAEKALAERSKE